VFRSSNTLGELRSRVLIIDDSVDVHDLLRGRLKYDELEFESAFTAEDGFKKAVVFLPDLILLDLALGNDRGLDLLRELKEDPRTRSLPVIIVSSSHSPEAKVAAFDLGSVDYITKPFELIELRVRIRSALRMHQLLQMLAQRAQIDGLTGLWNRAFFDKRWLEEYARSQRHAHPLSLALLDLDHFKGINDKYGHPIGDIVLQTVARVLQRECRQHDLACRFGGEEFVIVMPDTKTAEAEVLCERIRHAVEQCVWSRAPELKVTASIGVSGCNGSAQVSAEEWVEIVDRNLYTAKRNNRNRVIASEIPSNAVMPMRSAG
jgi:diguanylate cyclase (GGDEF)-like protein